MDALSPLIDDIYRICEVQGLLVDSIMQESGPGQFEINLKHRPDALGAALDGLLLKRAVKTAARAHQLEATFMAKPHHDWAGSGMHIHLSLLDQSGQNVFAVSGGTVITPPINGTLLAGITRDAILSLASDLGIPVREQPVPREMLYGADEVFLTGTASEVTPVRSVDRITIGRGRRGPVTEQIQRHFLDVVHGRVADRHDWLTFVREHVGDTGRAPAAAAAGRA
jgi:hypothetical protein